MGGNDGCLANFGCGALSKDTAVLTLGTSGAVRLTISKPEPKELNGFIPLHTYKRSLCDWRANQ
jgi:sugar (pentulose or hexulose) kinase